MGEPSQLLKAPSLLSHMSEGVPYISNIKLYNSGKGAKFTRGRKWILIYKEKINSKSEAISREYYIKKNRKLRNLIKRKR